MRVRVLVAVAVVLAGGFFLLSGQTADRSLVWALLLPAVSIACIAALWE